LLGAANGSKKQNKRMPVYRIFKKQRSLWRALLFCKEKSYSIYQTDGEGDINVEKV
jgi:hypothetical protein